MFTENPATGKTDGRQNDDPRSWKIHPPSFDFHHAKLVFTGDGKEEELVKLIKDNTEAVRKEKDRIVIASQNFRVEIVKNNNGTMESSVTIHDERPSKSLAERLLKKIMTEHKQTKSGVALRVVSLQVLGHPSPQEWLSASREIHTRLCGMSSRPDAVFVFQKRWSGEYLFWDEVGFWTTIEKGRIALEPTSQFLLNHERLE